VRVLADAALVLVSLACAGCAGQAEPPLAPVAPPAAVLSKVPAALRPLVPADELALATNIWRVVQANGPELGDRAVRSLDATPRLRAAAEQAVGPYVASGRAFEGWVFRINWRVVRDGTSGGSPKYENQYSGLREAPVEVDLAFPEDLLAYYVVVWGHNVDLDTRETALPPEAFAGLETDDWVRVSGRFRTRSTPDWEPTKASELLSLGEVVITRIEKLDPAKGAVERSQGEKGKKEEGKGKKEEKEEREVLILPMLRFTSTKVARR
jgi:hypothetical protein